MYLPEEIQDIADPGYLIPDHISILRVTPPVTAHINTKYTYSPVKPALINNMLCWGVAYYRLLKGELWIH